MQISFDTSEPLDGIIDLLQHVYGVQITVEQPHRRTRHDKVPAPADTSSSEPSGGTQTT
jgi:hypothetical protein